MSEQNNDPTHNANGDTAELTTAALAGAGNAPQPSSAEPHVLQESTLPAPPADRASAETADANQPTALLPASEADEMRSRWDTIQASFVDDPRQSVEQVDSLVAGAMKRLAEIFAEERAQLEGQWDRGEDVSTEDLRQALRRYKSFFQRLLSI